MTTTLDGPEVSPRLKHPAKGQVLHRLVGVGFAAAAIGNAIGTIRQAPSFLQWLADGAWIPPLPMAASASGRPALRSRRRYGDLRSSRRRDVDHSLARARCARTGYPFRAWTHPCPGVAVLACKRAARDAVRSLVVAIRAAQMI